MTKSVYIPTKAKGVEKVGRSFRVRVHRDGVAYSKTFRIGDDEQAAFEYAVKLRKAMQDGFGSIDEHEPSDEAYLAQQYIDMFHNARKRGDYSLTKDQERLLVRQCENKCSLTGITFAKRMRAVRGWHRNPWAPSLDRIASSKGYTIENSRIICVAANLAMNEWGEIVLEKLAAGYAVKTLKFPILGYSNNV